MDKKNIEKLCSVLGDVIKIVVPIIVTAIISDSNTNEKIEQK